MNVADVLQPCAVRVDVHSAPSGSGFFVAPGSVVTCAHVIEALDVSSDVGLEALTIVDAGDTRHAVVDVQVLSPKVEDDLALLRLAPQVQHPCVLLDGTAIRSYDTLETWAYPKGQPKGLSRTFVATGRTGADRWVLGREQVLKGMSGAPVVNGRTGGVCGVINRTRDERQSLGGYAIPVRRLLELEPRLQAASEDFHSRDSRWVDHLTDEQRFGRHRARDLARTAGGMHHFVVRLRQVGDRCHVSAVVDPVAVDDDKLTTVPVDLAAVPEEVARLFRDWAASRGRLDSSSQIGLLGGILFRAAFPEAIGNQLRELLAEQPSERVLVSLNFDPSVDQALVELPWEHLCIVDRDDPDRSVYIATDERLGLARTREALPGPVDVGVPDPTLSVVVALALPEDLRAIMVDRLTKLERQYDAEADVLAGGVAPLRLDYLATADPGTLRDKLGESAWDVLHYLGSGRFENGRDQVTLHRSVSGELAQMPIEALASSLPTPRPKLVVLQHCTTGQEEIPADFSQLAPALLEAGVAAVVAYQYPAQDYDATDFNDALYGDLRRGLPLDMAVQSARRKLQWNESFVSPALFLRRPGQLRLAVPGPQSAAIRKPAYAEY
jgi:hypothetical protein